MTAITHLYGVTRGKLKVQKETLHLAAFALGCGLPGLYLLLHGQYSLLTVLLVVSGFFVAWMLDKTAAMLIVLAYLFLLGDVRRFVNMYAGYPKLDPLLLAGPVFTFLIALPIIMSVRVSDPLSKVVLGLTAVMTAEIVNPRQGPLLVGFSGALFYLVPIFWFWIGRRYATEHLVRLVAYRVVLPLAVTAALLGFYQTYIGFLPWEDQWVKHALENGYVALGLGQGHIRSFGFSVNSAEFGTLLMLGSVSCLAATFAGKRAYALLLPLLVSAQVLASMRGLLLKTLLASVMMWAVRGPTVRSWVNRLVIGAILGFGVLAYSVKHASDETPVPASKSTTSANLATSHVTNGLAHPLDPKYSTAGLHTMMVFNGFVYGLKNPLGMGLGMVTLGANKFGTTDGTGTSEVDISDAFITMGFIGGPLLLFGVCMGFLEAGKFVLSGPRDLSFLLLGLFIGMLGAWIPLGQYAVGPLMWFCVGFLSKRAAETRLAAAQDAKNEVGSAELAPAVV